MKLARTLRHAALITALALAAIFVGLRPGPIRALAQNVNCYFGQGGSAFTAGSGCTVTVASGGTLTAASGSTVNIAGTNQIGGVTVTSTAAELNVLHGVTAGTASASSGVVLDANKAVAGQVIPFGGAATTTAGTPLAGVTDISNAASGTTQNTEYTLNSVSIPASAFNANGRALRCEAWAGTAANANAKNIKVYFGSTAVVTVTGSTASGKDVHMELNAIRTGASAQTAQGIIQVDTGVAPAMATAAPTETDTNAIVVAIKSANTAAAAASATGKGLSCYFIN
jgi:hypothetical protein